ncbi:MAG: hypothetical protein C5B51_15905 [Terriglobia bacterium]|nr:MAG: hypothetical protein C5B51_15905 [Terriglobia bacterium]
MHFKAKLFFPVLFLVLLAARLCHVGILWAEEGLPLAAAGQLLHGKTLYRDIWFDKPPLVAASYLLWGAEPGWPLRLAGAVYALLACWLAYRLAREMWSPKEGFWAAALLGFFLIFDLPSSVTPLASDLLVVGPHLAAIWLAWRKEALWSGAMSGLAFLIGPKALIVAVACAVWNPSGMLAMAAGFLAVNGMAAAWLAAAGALQAYWEQVWQWGRLYASAPLSDEPLRNGLLRTAGWAGFHGALVIGAIWFFVKSKERWRWAVWLGLCLVGVAAGWRFFPRYYFLLLAPLTVAAARGCALLGRRSVIVLVLLLVPLARFGPRYILLAAGTSDWTDTAMDRDSRQAAAITRQLARPGDTLFVWGFRPEMYVYAELPAATRFLDSQPLTGVPADRHLTQSEPIETEAPPARRAELARSHPTFVIDGLGLYNPRLAITSYGDLRNWLGGYREVARSGQSIIYRSTVPSRE